MSSPIVEPSAPLRPVWGRDSDADDIRAAGWHVAVHNDYRLKGVWYTFWLFTKADPFPTGVPGEGRYARGEGRTDAEALNQIRKQIGLPPKAQTATYCDGPHTPPQCPYCVNRDGSPTHNNPEAVAARALMKAP